MPICNAILTTGLPCTYRARENDKCGTHKHQSVAAGIINLRGRIAYIYELDQTGALRNVVAPNIFPSVGAARTFVDMIENIIRTQYPGWRGAFARSYDNGIRAAEDTPRMRAINRMPEQLRNRIEQADIMMGWYNNLSRRLIWLGIVGATPINLYDDALFLAHVAPVLVPLWPIVTDAERIWYRQCSTNMRILGQTHISNAIDALAGPPPAAAPPIAPAPINRDGVQAFIRDPQNVHLNATVRYVEKLFSDLKKIPIPGDQKTLGEIMIHCTMMPTAEVQMVKMYHAGDSIYEHRRAYKRALDAVWAVIRTHENRAELYVRLAEEMNDNIGMCAQGNLSRICNILCGYSDAVKPPVPQGIMVQNKMAAIAGDSEGDKIGRAKEALRELMVPEAEWAPWIEAFDE